MSGIAALVGAVVVALVLVLGLGRGPQNMDSGEVEKSRAVWRVIGVDVLGMVTAEEEIVVGLVVLVSADAKGAAAAARRIRNLTTWPWIFRWTRGQSCFRNREVECKRLQSIANSIKAILCVTFC